MRSRAVHLALAAVALAAAIAAAFLISNFERQIATARTAERAFDAVVRDTTSSVAEFRGDGVGKSIGALRSKATTDTARAALDQAAAKAENITEIAAVLDQVNAARAAEQDAADDTEAAARRVEAQVLAGAGLIGLAVIAALVVLMPRPVSEPRQLTLPSTELATKDDLVLRGESATAAAGYVPSRPAGPVLRAASQLCTDLGRVSDVEELRQLVGRAAELMDASGLIVWIASPDRSQLLPAMSHGYLPEMVSRLPPLARSADNAAAAAFRTTQVQLVLARPGESNGAIVAPVLSSEGCIGVVSAEIRGGGEASESVQALAAIFAAQLANVLQTTPPAHEQRLATGT
jgi:hypothetical protein